MKHFAVIICISASLSASAQGNIRMKKSFLSTRFYYGHAQELKPKQVLTVMQIDEEAHAVFKKAKANYDAASVLGFAGGFLIGWPIGTALSGGEPEWGLAAGGAAITLLSVPLTLAFNKHAERAVSIYNRAPIAYRPRFYVNPYGAGARLTMKF